MPIKKNKIQPILLDTKGKQIKISRAKIAAGDVKFIVSFVGLASIGITSLLMNGKDSEKITHQEFGLVQELTPVNIEEVPKVDEKKLDQLGQQILALTKSKEEKIAAYIKRFKKTAFAEQKKFGIPASITLAQGLLESNFGESKLARSNNNHFGIKCFSKTCKKGHCSNFSDDTHKDFFRNYKTAWESYRAHSILLTGERYKQLFQIPQTDYAAWARGLKDAGYATDPNYAEKLIYYIDFLKLDKLKSDD